MGTERITRELESLNLPDIGQLLEYPMFTFADNG